MSEAIVEVTDNFLSEEEFLELSNFMTSRDFPWHFFEGRTYDNDGDFNFVHYFYNFKNNSDHMVSTYYDYVKPIIKKIKAKSFLRVIARLTTLGGRLDEVLHKDYDFECTTGIFYVNTNNGKTRFVDGSSVDSVANRLVTFPSTLLHTGTNHTDTKTRILINFNYFE